MKLIPCPVKDELEFCSNLMTTMVIRGASEEEIKRVVLYSMAVDATKMRPLNWGEARACMGIDELAKKYGEDKHD